MKSSPRDEAQGKMHQAQGKVADNGLDLGAVHCNQQALDLLGITKEELQAANTVSLSTESEPDKQLSREKAVELIAQWCFFGKPV